MQPHCPAAAKSMSFRRPSLRKLAAERVSLRARTVPINSPDGDKGRDKIGYPVEARHQ